jgi:hypothetical protein
LAQPGNTLADGPGCACHLAAAADVPHTLPWLGLLGCCCLQWAQQLASLPATNPKAAATSSARSMTSGVLSVLPQGFRNIWGVFFEPVAAPDGSTASLFCLCVEPVHTCIHAQYDMRLLDIALPLGLEEALLIAANSSAQCMQECMQTHIAVQHMCWKVQQGSSWTAGRVPSLLGALCTSCLCWGGV